MSFEGFQTLPVSKVIGSSNDKNSKPENVLDGNQDTRWSAKGVGESLTIDLGAVKTVTALAIKWYEADIRQMAYTLYSGMDGKSWRRIGAMLSSGTAANEYEVNTFGQPITGQYFKIEGEGNSLNSFISIVDLKVLGDKVPDKPQVTAPKPVTQSVVKDEKERPKGNAP